MKRLKNDPLRGQEGTGMMCYTFDFVSRGSIQEQGLDPNDALPIDREFTYLRAWTNAESDLAALSLLRERYPEKYWRLVALHDVQEQSHA